MSKFKLKETTVEIRGEKVRIRELTHGERLQWIKTVGEDRLSGPAAIVSLSSLDPKLSMDEVKELPSEVVEALTEAAMRHSGLSTKKEGKKPEKESDAGGAVPLSAVSGNGAPAE